MISALLAEKVLGTLLAAAFSAMVAVSLWLGNKSYERRRADALRQEKTEDLMRALLAEIEAYVHQLTSVDLDAHEAMMVNQMEAAHPSGPFIPIVPRESHDTVYKAFLEEIHLLPGPVVNAVVRYYNQVAAIANLASDMSTDRFASISGDRMAGMYRYFVMMKKAAREMGESARKALRSELGQSYQPIRSPAEDL